MPDVKRCAWSALFLLAACGGDGGTGPQPEPTIYAPIAATLDSAAAALDAEFSIAVARDGGIVFEHDTDIFVHSTGRAVPMASAAKWLSGVVLMTLVSDGTLALDDSVAEFFPDAPADKRGITLEQLMAHTSGLPANAPCVTSEFRTLQSCAAEILALPLRAEPGEAFYYGNASMQVAGAIAEIAAARTWEGLFADRVRMILGMSNVSYNPGPNPIIAGGGLASARDYLRLLTMLLDDGFFGGRRVMSAAAIELMEQDHTGGARIDLSPHPDARRYGIGVWRDRVSSGEAVQLSSQGATGFSPWIDRERDLAAVITVENADLAAVYAVVARVQQQLRTIADANP